MPHKEIVLASTYKTQLLFVELKNTPKYARNSTSKTVLVLIPQVIQISICSKHIHNVHIIDCVQN